MKFALLLIPLLTSAPICAADVAYVSVAGEKRIALFQTRCQRWSANFQRLHCHERGTGALTADPKRRFLFAALRSTGELAAFRIDPTSGMLTHINTVPAGADPAHISTDRAGRFLLTAYYVAGQVTVHAIGPDGSLGRTPRQTIKTKEKAHSIVLDPSESAALVPHTGPNVIYAFGWRSDVGEREAGPLFRTHIGQTEFTTPKETGPRHVVFHPTIRNADGANPTGHVAYVDNEQGGSVTMYYSNFNPKHWLLKPMQTVSTLPPDFHGTNACAEIRLHPSGRLLYVSNRGHDSIAGFRIDELDGRLTSLGQTPTEKTPRSFDLSPSGRFLYVAGESSGRLASFRVDQASGKLERGATYEVGSRPWWVMTLRLPGN